MQVPQREVTVVTLGSLLMVWDKGVWEGTYVATYCSYLRSMCIIHVCLLSITFVNRRRATSYALIPYPTAASTTYSTCVTRSLVPPNCS